MIRPGVGRRTVVLVAALCVLAGASLSSEPPHAFTIEDIVHQERAEDWVVSPDGTLAAWVKSTVKRVEGEEKRVADLWITRLASGESVPFVQGTDKVSKPAFSPDSRHVAFLSTRKAGGSGNEEAEKAGELGEQQLWAIPTTGGEAFALTRWVRSVRSFGWRDADALVVATQEAPTRWEAERRERKDVARVVEDASLEPPVRLFGVGLDRLARGTLARLTDNRDWIDVLAVAPDGREAVLTAQQSLSYEFDERVPPQLFLVDLDSGARRRLLENERLVPRQLRWSPDSQGFYFDNAYSRHATYRMATITELWYYALGSGEAEKVELDWKRGLAYTFAPFAGGVLALLHDGVRYRPARFVRGSGGFVREDLNGTHVQNLDELAVARDGRQILYQHSKATLPPQWYTAALDGSRIVGERRITELNPSFAEKPTGRVEIVRFAGHGGEEVEGILHYPLDWQEGTRNPLVLDIHGGPTAADRDAWDLGWSGPNLLSRQRGAFVLQVNYHGSSGYGLDWVESIGEGRYYELEVPDLEAGVDALIARGLVDPNRLAVSGWSNGGILSAALITHSRRYQAAIIGAADVEWFSDWGNVDFGAAFDNYYFGGPPWEIPEVYLEKSPFFRLNEVTTPTLVHTGTEDRNVPPSQSWSLFRVLQQVGKAPVKLVLYPGEPHGLGKVAHQRRKLEEDVVWLDRYLFEREAGGSPTLREGSLLSGLLARSRAARVGGAFGVQLGKLLVPETVPAEALAGLEVGRFEVTREQFAAFDASVEVETGRANLPVTGVGFERAQAYCRWLSEQTGRSYRLPTRAEAERLQDAAAPRAGSRTTGDGGGNTLDMWAGYAANPEDREAILEQVAPLGEAPLLLPVGSRPGMGAGPIFDLDGNAAEWAVGDAGEGVAVGRSADRPSDPASSAAAGPAYTGLRLVVEPP